MSEPTIEQIGQGIKIGWPRESVSLLFDRIAERSDGTHAEITPIMNGANFPTPTQLTPSRVNLLNNRSREDWCRRIGKVSGKTGIPWDRVLENSVSYVLRVFRRGESEVLLDAPTYPQKEYAVKPLVYQNLPSVIFALAAKCKSLTALFLCLLAECGESMCGLTVSQSHQTLFLDWELDQSVQGFRKQQILKSHPTLQTPGPLYRRMYRPLSDELQTIMKLVQEHDISLLIIDSLAPATGGDQIGAEGALRFFEALRLLNIGCLILAHTPKNTEQKTIYGNVFNHNLSRSVWELKSTQEENSNEVCLGFYHKKNNLGRLHASFGIKITFPQESQDTNEGIRFQSYDLTEDGELSQSLPLQKRLLQVLKSGAQTVKELSERLGEDQTKIRARLNEGKSKHFVIVEKDGISPKWGLLKPDF